MKKWIFILAVLGLLAYIVTQYSRFSIDNFSVMDNSTPIREENADQDELLIEVTKDQIYKGDLLLVNKEYPLVPGNEAPDIIQLSDHSEFVNRIILLDRSISLSQGVAEQFSAMVADANLKVKGISSFMVSSGYRDNQEQNDLYEKMGTEYAMPAGYSEHNLGLALDVGSTQGGIEQSIEGKWLRKNAWKYGFILRYPKDKSNITGIQYEPWHFRYIGLPHSVIMQENDMVLEEYIDFLKEKQSLSTILDGQRFDVHYYPILEDQLISIPANNSYTLSGNNVDGVIVTQRYE